MRIDILTLFPEMFSGPFSTSIIKRARDQGILDIRLWNIRDFAQDKHKMVDDTPYGGGAGMVLKPDVLVRCIEAVTDTRKVPMIYLSPQGKVWDQSMCKRYAKLDGFVLLCGHYEGIDQRVLEHWVDEEVSIGDYVLTGGELPAMVVVDSVARLLPGVLGSEESAVTDSFYHGLLEHPQYTRPAEFRGLKVPEILLSGHHQNIARWRLKESLRKTMIARPDLIEKRELSEEERQILDEIINEKDSRKEE
ncbi:MAG: tRNA (guanosine(37)-N1)-methyltransferase TrmD [Firmicutes bacterium]|jgi:tRNA (guanine37-N1)-methyltransferase|nr:tRNA (guanosine(37)-N1)-methyltransferase TrmD [Bacillota bacterium]